MICFPKRLALLDVGSVCSSAASIAATAWMAMTSRSCGLLHQLHEAMPGPPSR